MRDIKFRAWDEKTKSMVNIQTLHLGKKLKIEHDKSEWDWYKNQISIMQYTGLKDRNGMEIFESDILRAWHEDEYIPNRDSGGGIIDYDREEGFSQLGIVGFEGCSFEYKTVKTTHGRNEEIHAPIDWLINYEVVGNIYENPELLSNQDSSKTP